MIEIEKGVPLPQSRRWGKKYPFAEMVVGDFFVAPDRVQMAATDYKKHHPGWDYTSSKLPDGQRRIWRTA